MKRIFIYLALLTIGLSFSSCTEEIDTPISDAGALTITLKSSDLQTKTMEGVQSLNENLIQTIHYFLYPNGGTGRDAVLKGSVNTNKQITESFTVPLDENILNQLFPYPQTQCQVFLIVNLPNGISIPQNTSIDNLKTIALSASFTSDQLSFVMAGQGVATLADKTKNPVASGDIKVDRIAAKLTLNVDVAASYTDGSTVWTSIPNDMTVSLYNCINNNAQISGEPVATPSYINITNHRFDVTTGSSTHTCSCDPFYSYPIEWEPGTETEPYFMIMLPWKTGNLYQPCYYKVILNGTQLEKNNWYNIDLNLGILGSFNETEPKVVVSEANYYVVDWSTGKEVTADIQGARYLVVDQTTYEVYNQDEVRIPFSTSHTCEIVDMSNNRRQNQATVIYPDYSGTTANENREINWQSSWYLAIEKNDIVLKHTLRNDISQDDFDYAPYTFKFTIRHTGVDAEGNPYGDVFYKDMIIVQYPAMVIQAQANRELQGTGGFGGTYVNSYQNNAPYGGLYQLSSNPATKNPNMYVIKASVLPSTSNLIIGDPRSLVPTDLNNNNWTPAQGIEGGANRRLQNYYQTLTTSEVKYMIAPKFRTASSHGVCQDVLSYTQAEYRCASYQEDGYPAGRWRIPTLGEVQFMVTLSNERVIPELYSSIAYWYAGGIVQNNGGSLTITEGMTGEARVRCVYDEWYWEKSNYPRMPDEEYSFAWGDAAR